MGWGCQIAVDVDNSGNVVLGHLSPDGTRSKEPNLIHVDIAAAPAKDWEPPYVSVLISLPRETSVSEHYVTNLDNTSTQHIVEMRLRASGNDDQGFEVTACKSTRGDNCYHVTISNIKHALVSRPPVAISCSNSNRRAPLLGWGLGSQLSQWRCERKPAVSAFIQGDVGLARLAPEARHGAPGARPAKHPTLRHVLPASTVQAGRQALEF